MTLDDVRLGLKKTIDAVSTLRAFKRAAILGVTLPTGNALDTQLPPFATFSLLDDTLQLIIDARYPGTTVSQLANRIDFLGVRAS